MNTIHDFWLGIIGAIMMYISGFVNGRNSKR